ncbi:ABC transporter permease [Corynebacterium qintianiae]|uniref:ABC transporter permease n=1 Tax=Corynebacterium qintianiae TaxID=2709392 RepID=UPI001F1D6D73|nr:ABC transporter permease [Corynebacterium qintianiae]
MGKHHHHSASSMTPHAFRGNTQAHVRYVDLSGLRRLDIRPSIISYVQELWRRRFFILADARARSFQDQRDFVLGKFWLVGQPLLDAALYGIMFGLLLQTARGVDNFIGYLILGVTFFGFMSKGLTSGIGLIRSQKNLIAAFNFPRASVVFSRMIRNAIDSFVPALVAVVIALVMQWDRMISPAVLQVIPLYLLLFIFAGGLSFFSARMTAFFPDARVIITFISRIWFYSSCVFFPIERFSHLPRVQAIMELNPGYRFLDAIRESVLDGALLGFHEWGFLLAWSFGTLICGLIFFWQAEEKYVVVE